MKQPIKIGEQMISNIIGPRPRKPASYDIRKLDKKNEAFQKFCKDYDDRLAEWERKADEIRQNQTNQTVYEDFDVTPPEKINITSEALILDFKKAYKFVNKKEFQDINSVTKTNEPEIYVKTLAYYFNKDKRFFKSPLLRKDLSEPSFDKGVLSIGKYGCGKSTIYKAFVYLFNHYVDHVQKTRPSNQQELLDKFRINKIIATELVLDYKKALANSRISLDDILLKTRQRHTLYIDDLLKEEILFKTRDNETNLFKDILTLRDEYRFKTHASINFLDKDEKGVFIKPDVSRSLKQFYYKYNGTVYDRAFGMFNIIELKGGSMRG